MRHTVHQKSYLCNPLSTIRRVIFRSTPTWKDESVTAGPSAPPLTGQHAGVLDAVGGRIAAGDLAPGSVVTLDGLCETYAVSRSVAREVVRVLESMGLVASRRRVGVTIQPRSAWHVFDPQVIRWRLDHGDRAEQLLSLSELRRGVEPVAAALAATRASAEQCRELAS